MIHRTSIRFILALSAITIAFIGVVGYASARWQLSQSHSLRRTEYKGEWIRAPGELTHAGYFRKRYDLTGKVRHAWVKITAADALEFNVNRNPMGRQYLWRPTRPFQSGSSEKGQILLPQDPALALNFPREYQWSGHDNWLIPYYVDLTPSFVTGKNVIAVEVESRSAPAMVNFTGEIVMWSGQVIPIRSDETWLSEPAPPGPQLVDWTEKYYWDKEWRHAVACKGPTTHGTRSMPEEIYSQPFVGKWMRLTKAATKEAINFRVEWDVPGKVDEAWMRMMANRSYELYINNTRVTVASTKPPDLDNGEWVFGRGSALDPRASPELLDPDEVGTTFVGKSFESPRDAAPGLEMFKKPFSPTITPFRYERTNHRAQEAGVLEPKRTLAESRRTPKTPDLFPERPIPNSLKHEQSVGGFLSYSVANLVHPGRNIIEIRCLGKSDASWPTQIAVDGGLRLLDGSFIEFPQNATWTAEVAKRKNQNQNEMQAATVESGELQKLPTTSVSTAATSPPGVASPVIVFGPAHQHGQSILPMQYRGNALHPATFSVLLPRTLIAVTLLTLAAIGAIILFAYFAERRASQNSNDWLGDQFRACVNGIHENSAVPLWISVSQMLYAMLLAATVTVGAGLLLEVSWIERQEILLFLDGTMWRYVFGGAIVISLFVGLLDIVGRVGLHRLRDRGHVFTGVIRALPETRVWVHLLIWVAALAFLVRGYKLDLQPLDDDEYASTQAVMSIMETGAPAFVPKDVYYTRSPLYHYITAVVALPFGGDLWTFRLQTVSWGVATAWLCYLIGSQLLGSRWVGLFSMVLVAVHPFEIFTCHVIRFYQMQQFFALLTMYFFCRGFVSDQSQGYRIATIITFLAAVVSQEITIAMGPSIIFGYLVFAKDLGWTKNVQLGILGVIVVGIIALDFIVFQTLCLTRTEGVSPSIEAAVKPHFWYPLNMLSMFIGYSRLHVVPSLFFFAGLPLLWREQNRNTLAILAFLISGVILTNLLVTNVSLRYMYWLFPVWIVLCVDGMRLVFSTLVSVVYPPSKNQNRYVVTVGACMTAGIISVLCSWSLWRIPSSYELRVLGDSTGAVRWVRSQKRPGDQIAITEPHTHCAFIEGDKCDYDLAIPLLYDFAVVRDGVLVDRNGSGEVISNLDQLIGVVSKGKRVWIILNREKFRTRGKNLRWEYPGARFEEFIRKNCELKHRTYLWSVYLWDPARGHYRPYRLQE